MKLTTILAWAFAAVLSILIAVSAIAQCGGGAASGGASGSCGTTPPTAAKAAAQKPESKVVLSDFQKKKIAQIEKERDTKVKAVQPKFQKARQEVNALQDDPKATDEAMVKKIKEAMGYQAQIVAANMVAERRKDRVMTPAQAKLIAASQSSCGCGSSTSNGGGCGSPAPAAAKATQASGCGASAPATAKPATAKPAQPMGGCGSSCGG